ncbi:hypothetical protein [Streptomyces sp. NPDC093589]|uniref:hypothetical protein n=1 Tax=Streptomyces sp. NPDC093589 TaxID=3366043 RepID=UPI003828C1F6
MTARQEPLRVKAALTLVGLVAFGACYDVFDDPGATPVLVWHTMGMLLLIMVTAALTPLHTRYLKWLFKLTSKRGM